MRDELRTWMETHGESIEDYQEDETREIIKELSSHRAFEIAKQWLIENAFDDPEFWRAICQGINDTWHNKENLLNTLVDMIGHGHGRELDKYIKEKIYEENLLRL